MASSALEEKINKIRLQNEEIRRRYEEVEADKKNAAKSNALVQMVPSDDWPERKEPPEFSAPPKNALKQKPLNKEHNDRLPQHYSSIQDRLGKKDHKFSQGDGPPPDPKYNFLADSEREMRFGDDSRTDEDKNRNRNKTPRGAPRRRGGGGGSRDAYFKDNRGPQAFYSKEESLPEYEAWRAERNRIDEARINRQKTAEGNWRREWDNNKTHVEKDSLRKADSNRKDSNMYERRSNHYDSDYSNRGHGGSRTYHGSQKNHGHQDYRRTHEQPHEYKKQPDNKPPLSPTDDRTVTAIDKSIKVTVNHGNQPKGPLMSVKVNSPSIAGTGRVGPRQKSRITYSSQSDVDVTNQEFTRQKSFDEKTAGANFNNGQKSAPKSPFLQRKKEGNSKSPYPQKKEFRNDDSSAHSKNSTKTTYPSKTESRDQRQSHNSPSKPQRNQKRIQKSAVDTLENFSTSNDAIPSEYNPDKSFTYEDVTEQRVDTDNDDFENALNITNKEDEGFLDTSKSLDSTINAEPISESTCDDVIEKINYENNETDDIFKNHDDQEIHFNNENNIDKNIENDKAENEVPHNIQPGSEEKIDVKSLVISAEPTIIDAEQNPVSCIVNTLEIIKQDIEESELREDPNNDETNVFDLKNKNDLSLDNHTENQQIILKEELQSSVAEQLKENEAINDQKNDKLKEIVKVIDIEEESDLTKDQNNDETKIADLKTEKYSSLDNQTEKQQTILNEEIQLSVSEQLNANEAVNTQEDDKLKEIVNVKDNEEERESSKDQDNNEKKVIKLENKNVNDLCLDNQVDKPQTNLKEEIQLSEKFNENDAVNNQKDDQLKEIVEDNIRQINVQLEKDSEFIKVANNVTNESIDAEENKTTELDNFQNKSINDSGFLDNNITIESIELNESATNSSPNTSANDSGFINDSSKLQNKADAAVIESNCENEIEENIQQSIQLDLVDTTKDISEKTSEICDIRSAASSETSELVKNGTEKNESKQELNETLENPTKDNDVNVAGDINERLESSKLIDMQKVIENESAEKESFKKEESMKVATE